MADDGIGDGDDRIAKRQHEHGQQHAAPAPQQQPHPERSAVLKEGVEQHGPDDRGDDRQKDPERILDGPAGAQREPDPADRFDLTEAQQPA
jgi:hypothetical protein